VTDGAGEVGKDLIMPACVLRVAINELAIRQQRGGFSARAHIQYQPPVLA
jgi:hypothetical protein